jgi:acyl-CoA synthetase (AMP-forming)/AMP-acid ligase II
MGTAADELNYQGLAVLVDRAAERFGDRPLWHSIDDGVTIGFEQFRRQTLKCAQALRILGVGYGVPVAVMLPNTPAYVITWMALARLGAVMIPVNTRSTRRELDYVLRDSQSAFLVIDEAYYGSLGLDRDGGVFVEPSHVIVHGDCDLPGAISWEKAVTAAAAEPVDDARITPNTLMSVQYTSGSTGFPKGCRLTQDYWIVLGYARAKQGPPPTRLLIDKPLSYMGGMWRFLVCLYLGCSAFVARQFSLSALQQRLVDHRIDFFSATDAVAKLPDHPGINSWRVAWISISGLSRELHKPLEAKFRAPVRELYGLTETGATLYMPASADVMSGSGSCGIPAPFRECRIVNAQGHDVRRGEVGELWVRGRGILLGYHNQPEVSRAAFSGDWFRTGDLFKQDDAGYFYIQGRIKDSIRRSGENISAREVESVAAGVAGVLECAAVAVPDALRGQEVKLCISLQPGFSRETVTPELVIQHCSERLAPFKVPRYLEYLTELPRTSSGKIAKQELVTARQAVYDRTRQTWCTS